MLKAEKVFVPGDFTFKENYTYTAKEYGSFPLLQAISPLGNAFTIAFNGIKPSSFKIRNHKQMAEYQLVYHNFADFIDFTILIPDSPDDLLRAVENKNEVPNFIHERLSIEEWRNRLKREEPCQNCFLEYTCEPGIIDFQVFSQLKKNFYSYFGADLKEDLEIKKYFANHLNCEEEYRKLAVNSKKKKFSAKGFFKNSYPLVDHENTKDFISSYIS